MSQTVQEMSLTLARSTQSIGSAFEAISVALSIPAGFDTVDDWRDIVLRKQLLSVVRIQNEII